MLGGRRGLCSHISPTASYATLSAVERERMQLWADATRKSYPPPSAPTTLFPPPTSTSCWASTQQHHNTGPPNRRRWKHTPAPQFQPPRTSRHHRRTPPTPRNIEYLTAKLADLRESRNIIEIDISPDEVQRLYYEDPPCSKRMSIFPYIQTLVMLAFITVVYFAVLSTKKAEQNKVWVGL